MPRSNPDGYGVNVHCVDQSTFTSLTIQKFDGQNWDASISKSNISSMSKE